MSENPYQQAPRTNNDEGSERRVGIEIEMSGIDLSMIVCQCNIQFGGRIHELSPLEFEVKDTDFVDFKVELDHRYLKQVAKDKANGRLAGKNLDELEYFFSDALQALGKNIIPCELITDPVPFSQLQRIDALMEALRLHEAHGTQNSLFYAFGVHFNPELPNLELATLVAHTKAFLCLQDWLLESEHVSLSRRLSPFIDRFSSKYVRHVLNTDYESIEQFIDDYLRFNPTRNRALDLLPVLTFIDENRVKKVLPDEKINARPTLHYRLPNCDIDNPEWGLWQSWNRYLEIERLAEDSQRLNEMCEAFLSFDARKPMQVVSSWSEEIRDWLSS